MENVVMLFGGNCCSIIQPRLHDFKNEAYLSVTLNIYDHLRLSIY